MRTHEFNMVELLSCLPRQEIMPEEVKLGDVVVFANERACRAFVLGTSPSNVNVPHHYKRGFEFKHDYLGTMYVNADKPVSIVTRGLFDQEKINKILSDIEEYNKERERIAEEKEQEEIRQMEQERDRLNTVLNNRRK